MKRSAIIIALCVTALVGALYAHDNVFRVIPRSWDFPRPGFDTIKVYIDHRGDLSVFVGDEFVGSRTKGCEPSIPMKHSHTE